MNIPIKSIRFPLENLYPSGRYILKEVSTVYEFVDSKKTGNIQGTRYTVVDLDSLDKFDVKVPSTNAVITASQLKQTEEHTFVSFSNALVCPYRIEFGKAVCSVIADSVTIVQ